MCGIIGVYSCEGNAVEKTLMGLKDLEHRGQEGAGLAWSTPEKVSVIKDFVSVDILRGMCKGINGNIAIGHTRYSTTGDSCDKRNLQPIDNPYHHYSAIAHNGNLVNTVELKELLLSWGITEGELAEYSSSDTGLIAALIHHDGLLNHDGLNIRERLKEAMKDHLKGAYSIVINTRSKLIATRDAYGIRPLFIARTNNDKIIIIASETCAFRLFEDIDSIEEVKPGEMIVIEDGRIHREQVIEPQPRAFCIFEWIYFARPDSIFDGQEVWKIREDLGRALAAECNANLSFLKRAVLRIAKGLSVTLGIKPNRIVTSVPDSGTPASVGFFEEYVYPCRHTQSLLKVRGMRTFLGPDETLRRRSVREKLAGLITNIFKQVLEIVDDSIVRGHTSKEIVGALKQSGADEVHMKVHSPSIKWPCFYGIDTQPEEELIASHNTIEGIRAFLGANSLTYLSEEGMCSVVPNSDKCCKACFTGEYPIPIPEEVPTKDILDKVKTEA